MMYVLLLIGFVLLIRGADWFVDGSAGIARRLRIPPVIIGLTIVAMGTSAPEAAVSITAGLAGSNDIALSNIIGSNIFNLLMVTGVCAILYTVRTELDILKRDLPVNIGVTALLLLLLVDLRLSRVEGLLLLFGLLLYLVLLVHNALKNRAPQAPEYESPVSIGKSLALTIGGLMLVIAGGRLVVDNASTIAAALGLSQRFIGLTIVAIGTSLPELTTSIIAAKKGESGLALGNAVGSCIFNILFILGFSALLQPLTATTAILADTIVLLAVTALTFATAASSRKTSRLEGAFCALCYTGYLVFALVR